MTSYPWATGPLLDEPHTYQYSPVVGSELLRDWRRARSVLLEAHTAAPTPPPSPNATLEAVDGRLPLRPLLEVAHTEVELGHPPRWADVLTRRFEVARRLHRDYDAEAPHRAGPAPVERATEPYVRLGELLARRALATGDARDANVLCKVCDTLTVLVSDAHPALRARAAAVARSELTVVQRLADRVRVTVPSP